MQLSVIIVNYNVKYYVEQSLLSVFHSRGVDLNKIEVFVVDNHSRDDSAQYIRQRFPKSAYPHFTLIANQENAGFGRANNQALHRAKGKYVLFLNPDTILTEHTLSDVISFAESHPDMGAVGVKMLHSDGTIAPESRRGLPTPWVSFCKMSGLCSLFPKSRIFGRYYMKYQPWEEAQEIDIVSGAFMFVSRKALEKVGSFDETFFMYGEDIDLSYRLKKAKYHNYYLPTPILHYKGESTVHSSFRNVHVFYEAMLIFFQKHYHHYHFLLSLPIKTAIILRAILALLLRQKHLFHHFLYPRKRLTKGRMLYLGHSAEAISQLAETYAFDIDCIEADEESLPEGHLSEGINNSKYCRIVYDSAAFSKSVILRLFSSQPQKNLHIGTYNSDNDILITANKVYHS